MFGNNLKAAYDPYGEDAEIEEIVQKIVKEFKNGATISYLNNKYGISGMGTVSRWNQEYDKGILAKDNRGKRKYNQELEDIDILKKSYALLMEIRSQRRK